MPVLRKSGSKDLIYYNLCKEHLIVEGDIEGHGDTPAIALIPYAEDDC